MHAPPPGGHAPRGPVYKPPIFCFSSHHFDFSDVSRYAFFKTSAVVFVAVSSNRTWRGWDPRRPRVWTAKTFQLFPRMRKTEL